MGTRGRNYLTVLVLLYSNLLIAGEFHLLDLDKLSVAESKFIENRDPMTPQYSLHDYDSRSQLQFNVRILEVGYWNNDLHTETAAGSLRTVGWQWEGGVHVSKYVDLFYEHHSRHELDQPQLSGQGFPLEDSYGVRLNIYVSDRSQQSLFGGK